jgi:hypothetical protein
MKIGQDSVSSTKEIIRAAEKFIQSQQYDLALRELATAQRVDPNNMYIKAIAERIHSLIQGDRTSSSRFLSVTVGKEFENGIKPEAPREVSPIEAQVQKLTAVASSHLRQGAYETAFETLFDAYLLDPCSPTVLESEKTLLPAIEMMRHRLRDVSPSGRRPNPASEGLPSPAPTPAQAPSEESNRLHELMRRKEEERLSYERAKWREASAPPKPFEADGPVVAPPPVIAEPLISNMTLDQFLGPEPPTEPKPLRGFLSRFRRRKSDPVEQPIENA